VPESFLAADAAACRADHLGITAPGCGPFGEAQVRALVDQSMAEKIVPIDEMLVAARGSAWNRDTSALTTIRSALIE